MPLCTTILDKWLYVCRRSTSKSLLAAFLCLPNGRCNEAIAHFARTVVFFSKTCDCHPPNDCFSQKRVSVNPRTTVFLKNMRLSTPEQLFFSKTSDCQPPNERFSQKRAIVNPRTGRRNDVTTHIDPRIACCNDATAHIDPRIACCNGVTAHIDPRIDCCKAQQLILTPESLVARRNSSY